MTTDGRTTDAPPLQEPTLFILLSLAPGQKHGYAILKDVEALSHGKVRLSIGTLYGALSRLLELGWIDRVPDDETGGNGASGGPGRPRKAYRLTDLGRRMLAAETERLQTLAALARSRLSTAEERP